MNPLHKNDIFYKVTETKDWGGWFWRIYHFIDGGKVFVRGYIFPEAASDPEGKVHLDAMLRDEAIKIHRTIEPGRQSIWYMPARKPTGAVRVYLP